MLSIIIPYYKLTFFEWTLNSLAFQTDKRFKVYIGDDASPENPKVLLEKYKGKFDFVYHRFDNNLGEISLTQQWERCVNSIPIENREWVMILGDDDVLGENVVEKFNNLLYNKVINNILVVRYSTVLIDGNSNVISKKYEHPVLENCIDSFFRKLNNLTRNSLSEQVFNLNYKEIDFDFIETHHGLYSDDLLILDFAYGTYIYTINDALVRVRKSELNLSGGILKIKKRYLAFYQFYVKLLKSGKFQFNKIEQDLIYSKFERGIFNFKSFRILFFLLINYTKMHKFKELFLLMGKLLNKAPLLLKR